MSGLGVIRARSPAVAALQGLVSASVACVACTDPVNTAALDPAEAAFLHNAAASRVADFSTGRDCAHLALGRLGLSTHAIPVGRNRQPLWPDRVVGSITHCTGFYAAAVARTTDLRGLGIDAERSEAVDRSLDGLILSPAERDWMDRCDEETRAPLRAALFSIKESVFKCVFPLTRLFLEFHDVEVRVEHSGLLSPEAGTVNSWVAGPSPAMTLGGAGHAMTDFVAVVSDSIDIPDRLRQVRGRFVHCDGFVLSVAEIPA